MATIDPWSEEYDRLTQTVEEWFRQATKRFAVPSADGCRMVAFYLMALRHPEKDQKKPARQTKVVRHGKLFLHHLLAERRQIKKWISLASKGRPALPWLQELERGAERHLRGSPASIKQQPRNQTARSSTHYRTCSGRNATKLLRSVIRLESEV